MATKKYSYQTFPGQTIIRETKNGFCLRELIAELRNNGVGIIVNDSAKEEHLRIMGKRCEELKVVDY